MSLQFIACYCIDCGIKHLVSDCPLNPDKKGKATLNVVEILPSSSGNKSEVAPVNVVTRAQAQKNAEV